MEMKLRLPQERAVQAIEQDFRAGKNRLLLRICTGGGKTIVAAALPRRLALPKRKLFLAHREELITQAAQTLRRWNPGASVGIEMAAQHCSPADEFVVSSIQTIGRSNNGRIRQFSPADFSYVVVDECQHSISRTYKAILSHFQVWGRKDILVVGLTATPNRADGRGLHEIFQKITFDYGILPAIREGYLVDLNGYRIRTATDLSGVHSLAGDFEIGELGREVNTPARNDLAVRAWLDKGENRQTVAYCVDVRHAKDVAEAFRRYGVCADAIWGGDPDRSEKLLRHKRGHLKVLANCALLTEGYDDPNIGCVLMTRPTQSESLYCQIVGRGTRLPDGIDNLLAARQQGIQLLKEDCVVIDLVDNTSRHSLITLPSLFGMNPEADLRGNAISRVTYRLEQLKAKYPLLDFTRVKDIDTLEAYCEHVALLPEVIQISDFKWVKISDSSYGVLLAGGGLAGVVQDRNNNWHVGARIGAGRMKRIFQVPFQDLQTAIQQAEVRIQQCGGHPWGWSSWGNQPPSAMQLLIMRRNNIAVPPGANRAWCYERQKELLAKRRQELQRRIGGIRE